MDEGGLLAYPGTELETFQGSVAIFEDIDERIPQLEQFAAFHKRSVGGRQFKFSSFLLFKHTWSPQCPTASRRPKQRPTNVSFLQAWAMVQ